MTGAHGQPAATGMLATAALAATDEPDAQAWVVAVGASAGGLEALQRFFSAVQPPTQAAFIVIQHLAPDHRSMMVELLGRHCSLPVREAAAGEPLLPDHVYLMPPAVVMSLQQARLVLAPRPLHGVSLPIDLFLRSLASENPAHAIGVVLSGSGSDGAAGGAALRAAGGYMMAQTPETARFDSMPRSLMAATTVDAVLPPEAVAAQVLALTQGRAGRLPAGPLVDAATVKPALQRLFDSLMDHAGIDFGLYKLPTVTRRIERRMTVLGAASLADYADRVDGSQEECEALRRELLIPVTGFFRDPAAFAALTEVLREQIRQLPTGRTLRLWSAGCATGEEAYSLAIAALEACGAEGRWPGVKVFATDVDPAVLAVGSTGSYPAGAAEGLTPERLARHFVDQPDRLLVKPELRQMVLFARHNLLDDAPFTKMDLVVCRNTLIYFQAEAQDRVMRRLQYALNAQGVLFLGSSESLGALQSDFQAIDSAQKLYRLMRPVLTALAVREGFNRGSVALRGRRSDGQGEPRPVGNPKLLDSAQRLLMQSYVPLSLLVTAQRHLLHAWGPTQRYLRMPEGEPQLDAIRLLPPRLGAVAGHALHTALRERREHAAPPLPIELEGQMRQVRVVARPVAPEEMPEPCVLLCFEELALPAQGGAERPLSEAEVDRLALVERELAEARSTLQTSIEELEAANEELQATNEELMSSNEELQSTNEELQSVNEELYTVNAEYNAKLDTVSVLNADLDGMSQATGIATLFVDRQQQLLRFTPEAAGLFRLRPSDVGRPLADFRHPLQYPELQADLASVLAGGPEVEREVLGPLGSNYLVRALGYGEALGLARRAVMTLIDVSRLRDMKRLQAVIDSMPAHIAVLDEHGSIRRVNAAWTRFALRNGAVLPANGSPRLTGLEVGANYLGALAHATSPDALEVLRGLQQVLAGQRNHYQVTYPCHSPDEQRWFAMQATRLDSDEAGAVVCHYDITPWRGLPEFSEAGNG